MRLLIIPASSQYRHRVIYQRLVVREIVTFWFSLAPCDEGYNVCRGGLLRRTGVPFEYRSEEKGRWTGPCTSEHGACCTPCIRSCVVSQHARKPADDNNKGLNNSSGNTQVFVKVKFFKSKNTPRSAYTQSYDNTEDALSDIQYKMYHRWLEDAIVSNASRATFYTWIKERLYFSSTAKFNHEY